MRSRFSAVSLLLTAAVTTVGCGGDAEQGQHPDGHASGAALSSPTPEKPRAVAKQDTRRWRFMPQPAQRERSESVEVEFLEGTKAELRYPRRLGLASMGVVPYSSGRLPGTSGRDFRVIYGDLTEYLNSIAAGTQRELAVYEGVDGMKVRFWDLPRPSPDYLGFQFGDWGVLVYDYPLPRRSMTDRQRAEWARSLAGHLTDTGYLRLESEGRLRLAQAGEHAGPSLQFGSLDGRHLAVYLGDCRLDDEAIRTVAGKRVNWVPRSDEAMWCLAGGRIRVQARGGREFIGAAIARLKLRDLSLAEP